MALCLGEARVAHLNLIFSTERAVRQSGSTGQTPGEPWSIKTCCPTIPRESKTEWPPWKRSLGEAWLCSGGSVWCINGFVEYNVWSLFFFWLTFVLRGSLSCGAFTSMTIQQEGAVLASLEWLWSRGVLLKMLNYCSSSSSSSRKSMSIKYISYDLLYGLLAGLYFSLCRCKGYQWFVGLLIFIKVM